MQNHHQGTERQKLGQKGSGSGHVTYFRNFVTISTSRERLELETSKRVRKGSSDLTEMQNWVKRGQVGVT